MATDIGPRIGIQGEAEFRRNIQNIIQQQKTLKAEMQATSAAFDKNTSAQEKTRKTAEVLNKQIDVQKQRVAELEKGLAAAASAYGENDTRTLKWKQAVESASAELSRFEHQLADLPSKSQIVGEAFQAVGAKIEAAGQKISAVGDKLTKTLTVPIVGGFAAATKASLSFEDGMAKVYTIADKTKVPIAEMSEEILELSNRTGKGAGELAEAAYQALSAGVSTEKAAGFVSTAADLAKAGFLETAGAVDVLTTIINAYGYASEDAAKIADQLIQTQNDGKTTVDQLAQSMGQVIPTAAALNVPLEQLNAAYVVMTKQGINTANTTTYLNGLFTQLSDTGSTVAKILKAQTGKTFGQLQAAGVSLGDVLGILADAVQGDSAQMLKWMGILESSIDTTDGGAEAFLNLWSNVRAGRGALSIVNAGVTEFNAEVHNMLNATGNVGTALEDLDTKGAKARRALNQLVNAGIESGDRFAPYVERAVNFVSDLLAKWDALGPAAQNTIIKAAAITAAVGPVVSIIGRVTTVIGAVTSAIGVALPVIAAVAAPVLGITVIIGALVAAGVALYKNWDEIKAKATAFKDALSRDLTAAAEGWSRTMDRVKQRIEENGGGIAGVIKTAVDGYISIWKGAFDLLDYFTGNKLSAIIDKVRSAIDKIKSLFSFQWELPKLKLPHFSWSWNDLGVIKIPNISVDWYKKAYSNPVMFNSPTVLPTGGGFKGFGDGSGGEIVIGKNTMISWIRDAMQSGGSTTFSGDINVTVYGAEGQSTEGLADMVAQRIYAEITQRRAAFG